MTSTSSVDFPFLGLCLLVCVCFSINEKLHVVPLKVEPVSRVRTVGLLLVVSHVVVRVNFERGARGDAYRGRILARR